LPKVDFGWFLKEFSRFLSETSGTE
jgi:hypothetical protein